MPVSIRAVCSPCVPDPTPSSMSGSGSASSRKNCADIVVVVVLSGVQQDLAMTLRASGALTAAALMNCGRAPTTVRIFSG